jgi:hypothetical protein
VLAHFAPLLDLGAKLYVRLPHVSWVEDNVLYLAPTLTSEVLDKASIENGHTVNLTVAGTCTSDNVDDCARSSNSSTREIINPVQSARLNTKISKSIRYGKVEVEARMPAGDWIWPAIWMMPRDSVYGEWPNRFVRVGCGTGRLYSDAENHLTRFSILYAVARSMQVLVPRITFSALSQG